MKIFLISRWNQFYIFKGWLKLQWKVLGLLISILRQRGSFVILVFRVRDFECSVNERLILFLKNWNDDLNFAFGYFKHMIDDLAASKLNLNQ